MAKSSKKLKIGHVQDTPVSTSMISNVCMICHMKVHIVSYNLDQKKISKSKIHILPNYEQTDFKTAIVKNDDSNHSSKFMSCTRLPSIFPSGINHRIWKPKNIFCAYELSELVHQYSNLLKNSLTNSKILRIPAGVLNTMVFILKPQQVKPQQLQQPMFPEDLVDVCILKKRN